MAVQQKEIWFLQELFPQLGEPRQGYAIDDTMIGRPAHVHNVGWNDFTVRSELGNDLRFDEFLVL